MQQQRPDSPGPGSGSGPSCVSMKSDWSMELPIKFKGEPAAGGRMQQQRPDSPGPGSGSGPSCVSMKSDWSMELPIKFKGEPAAGGRRKQQRPDSPGPGPVSGPSCVSMKSDWSMELPIKFKGEPAAGGRVQQIPEVQVPQQHQPHQEDLADCLQSRTPAGNQRKLKSHLQKRFQCLFEGVTKARCSVPLDQVYTELYITEGETAEVNEEHEVRQIETASRKPARPEIPIRQEDLFKGAPGRHGPIRTVMTKGVAGIGKTVLTQKFSLDWAKDQTNQDIQFLFPFTFRELNLMKDKKLSLEELLHHFFPEVQVEFCRSTGFQVLFILDGLDECRLPLNFRHNKVLTDITESTLLDVLLTNLIRGNLLPSALLWITTRPAAANQIPPEYVDMVTEVRGFTDPQKEDYFRKRFRDQDLANRIISHIKTSRSLHIMCHIPVFCWITATVLEEMLKTREGGELPKTLTQMYIHFLVVQTKLKKVKYDGGSETDPLWSPESRKMMESLGKLAFDQLQRDNLIFYESDLKECGIDIRAASVYSGVFTQIFREERGLFQDQVFCFVHLSVQEFLAALHVHLTFINSGVNLLLKKQSPSKVSKDEPDLTHLHLSAVNKALQSPNGHLDLFLRFFLGLSLDTNQDLLQVLQTRTGRKSKTHKETVQYIKKKINKDLTPEISINLFHCLNELNDDSLVKEIQQSLTSGRLSRDKLSPGQWSALVFILLSAEEDLDVFDLKKYSASDEGLQRLLLVLNASNKALLSGCNLSKRSWRTLSSVLRSQSSSLRHLDLSNNDLKDSGVDLLCGGLKSPDCRLETLRLSGCYLSERSCGLLSSVLRSQSSSLRDLDLSHNDLKDSGVDLLCEGLKSPDCRLETLSLSGCLVSEDGCSSLASALDSNPSYLRHLDLSYNHPGPSGVQLLSAGQEGPHWRLESLRVDHGGPQRLTPGVKKYATKLEVDTNTVNRRLRLSNNNMKLTREKEEVQTYPDHPDRFDFWDQLLCRDALTGRCYWEVEWKGEAGISVSYREISRKGKKEDCRFGGNNQSWNLVCYSRGGYYVWHNNIQTHITSSPPSSDRVAVYVDCSAGILSFYEVSSSSNLTHIYTINTTFTKPLYPGFRVNYRSLSLCPVWSESVHTELKESVTT